MDVGDLCPCGQDTLRTDTDSHWTHPALSPAGAVPPPRAETLSEEGEICPQAFNEALRGAWWFLLRGITNGMCSQAAGKDGTICLFLVHSRKHYLCLTLASSSGPRLGQPTTTEVFDFPGWERQKRNKSRDTTSPGTQRQYLQRVRRLPEGAWFPSGKWEETKFIKRVAWVGKIPWRRK